MKLLLDYFRTLLNTLNKEKRKTSKRIRKSRKSLFTLETIPCDASQLASTKNISISTFLNAEAFASDWRAFSSQVSKVGIPDNTGGVNQGDRRAIYQIVRSFKPASVLEIGTHIGASTTSIAGALKANHETSNTIGKLTTVDISDVNCSETKPWLRYSARLSPRESLKKLSVDQLVEFQKVNSVEFLKAPPQKYDFIFLDGSHDSNIVYQELPLALKALSKNGIILLHDFYPNLEKLWKTDTVIPGPKLATDRLLKEGSNFVVKPLGNLEWETKHGENVTSLALVLHK